MCFRRFLSSPRLLRRSTSRQPCRRHLAQATRLLLPTLCFAPPFLPPYPARPIFFARAAVRRPFGRHPRLVSTPTRLLQHSTSRATASSPPPPASAPACVARLRRPAPRVVLSSSSSVLPHRYSRPVRVCARRLGWTLMGVALPPRLAVRTHSRPRGARLAAPPCSACFPHTWHIVLPSSHSTRSRTRYASRSILTSGPSLSPPR